MAYVSAINKLNTFGAPVRTPREQRPFGAGDTHSDAKILKPASLVRVVSKIHI